MLKVAVGHSNDPDSQSAILTVLKDCIHTLAGARPKAGLLLAAIDFDHALILQHIHEAFPAIELIGGTTDGEISSVLGFQQDSLTLMLFCSDEVEISAGLGRSLGKDPIAATRQAVEQAQAKSTAQAQFCLTIPDSLTADGASILAGLTQALGADFPLFGGLAADQWRFQQTYQFFQTEVLSDAVPVLLFSGAVFFSHGVASGWQPIGKRCQITKVVQNTVYEIDGKPALEFYRHYLGALPPSSEYPIAVFEAEAQQFYLRAPSGHHPEAGSITFFAHVPEQSWVQLAQSSREQILVASQASMATALETYPGQTPEAALFFSCASRRQMLGTRTQEEYGLAQKSLTQVLPSCGFYANGEFAPLVKAGQPQFHNETFVTLLLGTQ